MCAVKGAIWMSYVAMLANFLCWHHWPKVMPRWLVKCYLWVCLWGYFRRRFTFDSVDWEKRSPSSMCVGIIQSVEGLKRTKRQRKDIFPPSSWAGTSIFSCPVRTPGSWDIRLVDGRLWDFSASITPWANAYTRSSPISPLWVLFVLLLWRSRIHTVADIICDFSPGLSGR